jgi:S1-C subfamily serine protease
MRKFIICVFVLLMIMPSLTFAKSSNLTLSINGVAISKGAPPVILNNSTYIPLRSLFENIDFTVVYYPEYKSALASYNKGPFEIAFTIDSDKVEVRTTYLNSTSKIVKISGKPILIKGSVYVPMRAFSELLGSNVNYDKYKYVVYFNSSVESIRNKIYPLVSLSIDEPSSINNLDKGINDTKKTLSAKEIALLMDRVGYVVSYDIQGNAVSSGSGFTLSGGIFITNHHVIENSSGIMVKIDGVVYDSHGWYKFDNPVTDIFGVFLSTSYNENGGITGSSPYKFLNYNVNLPEIGDKVYAIGSPQGLENSLSEGIVSGIRTIDGITTIQHTADIDHGSSGGALIDEYGNVIGVTNAGIGGGNLEFAIPIKYVIDEVNKL